MFTKKKKTVLSGVTVLSLWSGVAMAAKNATLSSTISGWPLPFFIAGLIVFRKKIFHGHDLQSLEFSEKSEFQPKNESIKKEAVETKKEKPIDKPVKKKISAKKRMSVKAKNKIVDLTKNCEQCQDSTSMGIRCKRTNTLENASLIINNTTYKVIVCAQHHNNKLKPYPELID